LLKGVKMIVSKTWEITEERKETILVAYSLLISCGAWIGIDNIKAHMATLHNMIYTSELDTLENDSQSINDLIEILAAGEHEQWAYWAKNILETEPGLSQDRKERWPAIIATPYKELPEELKDLDRREVHRRSKAALKEIRRLSNRNAELEAELALLQS